MTLHLALITPSFVLQVGDRQLSTARGGQWIPWDHYANKTIVAETINGSVVVSYAGLAHVDQMSTDAWLLQAITRAKPPPPSIRPGAGPPMRFGGDELRTLTVGDVMTRLTEAIDKDFVRQSSAKRQLGLEVLVTGWTYRRRARYGLARPRTFATSGTKRGLPPLRFDQVYPRRWFQHTSPLKMTFMSIGAGGPSVNEIWPNVRDTLVDHGGTFTIDDAEDLLAAEIRRVARLTDSGVGRNLMSIRMPGDAPPSLRYLPDPSLPSDGTAYSPAYVNAAGMVIPPLALTGSGTSFITGTETSPRVVTIDCVPPLPSSHVRTASSQARKRLR